jgi:hypothetical protein
MLSCVTSLDDTQAANRTRLGVGEPSSPSTCAISPGVWRVGLRQVSHTILGTTTLEKKRHNNGVVNILFGHSV